MKAKYSPSSIRSLIGPTGPFSEYVKKWAIICGSIGLVTGALVTILDGIVRVFLLGNLFGGETYNGVVTIAYFSSPAFSFLLPFLGLTGAGLFLYKFSSTPQLNSTEEVLEHYHTDRTPMKVREGVVKYFASILTIGLGGSAGLEGPSINAGGTVGSWLWRQFEPRYKLTEEDLRIMLLAGASAGIAAIFKAPLTGIVFSLEVPYKDDLARRAFFPSMVAGVVSYVTFASVEGAKPLFSFPIVSSLTPMDFALSTVLGIVIGLLAIVFVTFLTSLKNYMGKFKVHPLMKYAIGGAMLGLIALTIRLTLYLPYSYGPGYNVIEGALLGSYSIPILAALLVIRMVATALTVDSGGIGGMFFPLVVFGSLTGSLFGLALHGNPSLWASVGIAAFMSSGYKTPLAAVTFVGDTTGSVSFLIPAMIASATAYVVSGERTVSTEQILAEEVHLSEFLGVTTGDVMKLKISPLSADSSAFDVIEECFAMRTSEIIYVDRQEMPRSVSLQEALKVPVEKRNTTSVTELPSEEALTVSESDTIEFVTRIMFQRKVRIVAVSSSRDKSKIVGALAYESILDYIETARSASTEKEP
jgi:chloride channel protein, CIC family